MTPGRAAAPELRFDLAGSSVFDADEMVNLGDHAAHRRRVLEDTAAVTLVETQADQGRKLVLRPPAGAADLGDLDGLASGFRAHRRAP